MGNRDMATAARGFPWSGDTETERRELTLNLGDEEIGLRQANEVLLREGFHGVLRLDEVRRVEKLPVLGTGKTDYKVLRAQILAKEPKAEGAVR